MQQKNMQDFAEKGKGSSEEQGVKKKLPHMYTNKKKVCFGTYLGWFSFYMLLGPRKKTPVEKLKSWF